MSKFVTAIRTEYGELPIDYNALANKPTSIAYAESAGYAATAGIAEALKDFNPDNFVASGHNHDGEYVKLKDGRVEDMLVLKSGIHYGEGFPSNPKDGRIFFKKVTVEEGVTSGNDA